jgi:hypothetical protein
MLFPPEAFLQPAVTTVLSSSFSPVLAHRSHYIARPSYMPIRSDMSLPRSLHLSAALTLVESKPKHLTIQGSSPLGLPSILSDYLPAYIQELRDSIETFYGHGKKLRRLNLSVFWQTQHDDLHCKLEKARDATFVLQKEKEALQAQVTELQARSKPGRKRKSADQEEPEKVKKMKTGTIAIAEFGSAIDVDPGSTPLYQVATSTNSGAVIKAMRHVHRVQTLCKGRMWNTDSNELAYNLVQTMQSLSLVVEALPRKVHVADSAGKSVVAVARSCITVFNGLKRMASLDGSEAFTSHVVHACVCFFDVMFTSLEEGAVIQVKTKRPDQETPGMQALAQLSKSLVENLRDSAPSCRPHAQILEGSVYRLLHRLGEAAHELLLEGPRNDDIEMELRNLPLPDDQLLDPVRQTEIRGMLTSAPLLLDTLRKAVTDINGVPFAGKSRLQLQRTLVDRIFGPGSRGPEASQDVLRLPKALGEPPKAVETVCAEAIQTKTDSFEAELWTLVGWDILGGEEGM